MLLDDLFRGGDTVRSRFNRQVRTVRCSPRAVSGTGFRREERLPGGRLFRLRRVTWKSRKSHHPQVTKGACSWLGSSYVGIPSLRRRSVGTRRTDIHVLTALSPHPCGSAHCASSAFGQRPSRVLPRLDVLRMKIKSRSKASRLKPVLQSAHIPLDVCDFLVGPALAGKRPAEAPPSLLIESLPVGASLLANALSKAPDIR
jgi:hypothetical protein